MTSKQLYKEWQALYNLEFEENKKNLATLTLPESFKKYSEEFSTLSKSRKRKNLGKDFCDLCGRMLREAIENGELRNADECILALKLAQKELGYPVSLGNSWLEDDMDDFFPDDFFDEVTRKFESMGSPIRKAIHLSYKRYVDLHE
jgi:hypothetical protein